MYALFKDIFAKMNSFTDNVYKIDIIKTNANTDHEQNIHPNVECKLRPHTIVTQAVPLSIS